VHLFVRLIAERFTNYFYSAQSVSNVSGHKTRMPHLHLKKIRVARTGKSGRLLGCLLACARIGRTHVRGKGPSLLLVRHGVVEKVRPCAFEVVVGRSVGVGVRKAAGWCKDGRT
jgi:hypothetical protein